MLDIGKFPEEFRTVPRIVFDESMLSPELRLPISAETGEESVPSEQPKRKHPSIAK